MFQTTIRIDSEVGLLVALAIISGCHQGAHMAQQFLALKQNRVHQSKFEGLLSENVKVGAGFKLTKVLQQKLTFPTTDQIGRYDADFKNGYQVS